MVNYAVPTSPGTARILHKVMGNKRMLPKKIQKIAGFKPPLVVCKDHMENHAVLDGDGIFLHYQVRHFGGFMCSWKLALPGSFQTMPSGLVFHTTSRFVLLCILMRMPCHSD